jgi:hypothetical protein
MNAFEPPISAGLPDCVISDGCVRELDRRWLCFRFLYLLARKNIAAPYTTDPPTAATTNPAVVPATFADGVSGSSGVSKTPGLSETGLEEAASLPPLVAVAPDSMTDPGVRGMAGLM